MKKTVVVSAVALMLAGCGERKEPVPKATTTEPAQTATPPTVVALGDSISLGGDTCGGCPGFVDIYAERLGATADNLAIANASTADTLRLMRSDTVTREAVSGAGVVIVQIGFNDTPWNREDDPCHVAPKYPVIDWEGITAACTRRVTQQYARRLDAILTQIDRGSEAKVAVTTVYNSVIGDKVDPSWNRPAAVAPSIAANRAFAREQCRIAKRHHATCIDVGRAFNGAGGAKAATPLLASDHTHPNRRGHRLIAEQLSAALPTS